MSGFFGGWQDPGDAQDAAEKKEWASRKDATIFLLDARSAMFQR